MTETSFSFCIFVNRSTLVFSENVGRPRGNRTCSKSPLAITTPAVIATLIVIRDPNIVIAMNEFQLRKLNHLLKLQYSRRSGI